MTKLIVRRVAALVPLLLLVSIMVWGLLALVPGDPALAIAGEQATPDQVEAVRQSLGLDDPAVVQYWNWLTGAVTGDLGTSQATSYGVTEAIIDRLPVTVSLVVSAMVLSIFIGVPIGVLAAIRRGRSLDRLLTIATSVGLAVPNFWLGLILVTFLSLRTGWFPAGGYVGFSDDPAQWALHIFLPAVTLALAAAAELARQMRSAMIDVLERDFIRTHRAKGLAESVVVSRHALKNAAAPVVTVAGLQIGRLFGLAALVEQIFSMPGVGQLAIESVFRRDVPMIQGVVLTVTVVVVLANLAVDISYGYLNPRVRQ